MRRGYLINIENPNFSGIATLTFCTRKPKFNPPPGDEHNRKWTPRGETFSCATESGHGVRQLAAALGNHFQYAGTTKLALEISEEFGGLLCGFQILPSTGGIDAAD